MDGVANELALRHIPLVAPRQDELAGPIGRRGDQVSFQRRVLARILAGR